MNILLEILFWLSIVAMAHSYILYPLFLKFLANGKRLNYASYSSNDELPYVTILMAVYNEEDVLEEKLNSIFDNNYPKEKIEVLIGSDNSTDRTNEILEKYATEYPQLNFKIFDRQGKANILNQLEPLASGSVYIFTDANVFFSKDLIFNIIRYFKDDKIGQVGALFSNKGMLDYGIGNQEKGYIKREVEIKYNEGILWGSMIGAFGGCHAIRSDCFVKNPENFFMEDFYLSMHILSTGKKAILNPEAIVYEDVPNVVSEEFKRKIRISVGNFQNLSVYYRLLFPFYKSLGFCFLSHKVIRWLGPFFIIVAFISNLLLFINYPNYIYKILFYLQILGFTIIPLIDFILKKFGKNITLFRYITYFLAMNLALLKGFINYVKGIENNVWQPTKRNV